MPHHVVHRGNNRAAIFFDDTDRHRFRSLLRSAFASRQVGLHAYVLMDNHVHLLATPAERTSLAKAMHSLAQRYCQYFNLRHGRTGSLWEGRFKSFLVDKDRYLLAVCRYIELNPVRAGLAGRAEEYLWSSVHANLGNIRDPLITPHDALGLLGTSPEARRARYADWLDRGITARELAAIRRYSAQERALGSPRFQAMVERSLGRPAATRNRGRPAKEKVGGHR
ncbi:transposase [Arenimonas caeni]|jgi:putative transposase